MNKCMTFLTVAGWLAIAGMAAGQVKLEPAPTSQQPVKLWELSSDTQVQMAEDIEVFRRILAGAFRDPHRLLADTAVRAVAFSPDGKTLVGEFQNDDRRARVWDVRTGKTLQTWVTGQGVPVESAPEGVYLRGYGVVYSLTLPWHHQQPVHSSASPKRKPLGQWERVRQEIRGEKVKAEETKEDREEPSLADAVLKLLGENGRHFSRLSANEQLTVAMTLRPMPNCTLCHAESAGKAGGPGDPRGFGFRPPDKSQPRETNLFQFTPVTAADKDIEARTVEASNFAHLGDMRLKQSRPKEAAEAYQKAIALYEQLVGLRQSLDLPAAEARTKLAQAYLLLGEREKAFASLLQQARTAEKPQPGDKTPAGPTPASLPAKLIVSASKSQLDQVGAGKISLEDFRKAATVQFQEFPAARKEPVKQPAEKKG